MDALVQPLTWLNAGANAVGRLLLAPAALVPGWVSATLVAVASGVLLLVVFKYTSAQQAIRRVRAGISADLLALKLFKDSPLVVLRCQAGVLGGAGKLLLLGLWPMLVMIVPVCLLLGQVGLLYQARPLPPGGDAVLVAQLAGRDGDAWPELTLDPGEGVGVLIGPVKVHGKRQVCWAVQGRAPGRHRLVLRADGQPFEKEITVGDGFVRVSTRRPAWSWSEALLHPAEPPFPPGAAVRSVEIDYPRRDSWVSGTDYWVAYWLVVSLAAGFCCRGLFGVHL